MVRRVIPVVCTTDLGASGSGSAQREDLARMTNITQYRDFLKRKCKLSADHGFEVGLDEIHDYAKPHAKLCIQWAIRGGRRALFANFGLHKTVMQLEIARLV